MASDGLDPNERSRIEVEEKYDHLVLRSLLTDKRSLERIQTIPISIISTPKQNITVARRRFVPRRRPLLAVRQEAQALIPLKGDRLVDGFVEVFAEAV